MATTTYPASRQTIPTYAGTALQGDIDHADWHDLTNKTVIAIEDVLGTTSGTSVLKNLTAGQFAISSSDITGMVTTTGTQTLTNKTINNAIIGTAAITGGTANNIVIGTSTSIGGTINSATIGTPTVTGGAVNNSTIGTPAITGGTATSLSIVSPTLGTVTINGALINLTDDTDNSGKIFVGTFGHLIYRDSGTGRLQIGGGQDSVYINNSLKVNSATTEKLTNTSWTNPSDKRLKKIIREYTKGLNEILQIRPIIYEFKENNRLNIVDPGEHVGIIAQEIQKVLPETVTCGNDGFLRFTPDAMYWALINAVKELAKRVEELEKHDISR